MSTLILEAEARSDLGKAASRRLRRLENKVPGVVYGGDKKPQSIHVPHHKLIKALESEAIYSSVLKLHLDGKVEQVILKALQRHPYKPVVMHLDLQRVSAKDVLTKQVPLHFTHEQASKGVKAGGIVNHTMTNVEVRCQAQHLPEFIEVDLLNLDIDQVIHLSDLTLPKNVHLATDPTQGGHDHPVVSIHLPKAAPAEEVMVEEIIEEATAAVAAPETAEKAES